MVRGLLLLIGLGSALAQAGEAPQDPLFGPALEEFHHIFHR